MVLRDVEELSTDETAHVLDLSVDVVKTRLHRARLAIRQELDRYLNTGRDRRMPHATEDCRRIFATLSAYLDLELPPQACREMAAHLAGCPPCVRVCRKPAQNRGSVPRVSAERDAGTH